MRNIMDTTENNKKQPPRPLWKRILTEIYELFEAIFIIIGNTLRGVFKDMRKQPRIWGKMVSLLLFMLIYLLYSWLFSSCKNC